MTETSGDNDKAGLPRALALAGAARRHRGRSLRPLFVLVVLVPHALLARQLGGPTLPLGPRFALGPETGAGPIAVGIFFGSRDAGSLEVLLEGDRFLVPVERFAALAGARVESDGKQTVFVTPIGRVVLEKDDLREVEGLVYITQAAIEKKLATPIVFEPREYALRCDLPWRGAVHEGEALGAQTPKPVPDVRPPSASLSTLRSDALYRRVDGEASSFSSNILGGRLGGGWWRARFQDTSEGSHELREYAWVRTHNRSIFLAGQQLVQVHPLLTAFELTGMQLGWTNQPLELFARSPQVTELLPRGLRPTSSFSGPGPVGGMAELRIDGIVLVRQGIGLSGTYEFVDVPMPARQVSRVEVYVYDRHNLAVPFAIHDRSRSASEYLLPKGAIVQLGGAGYFGNLLNDLMHSERGSDYSGFFQWRQGISGGVTVEGAAERTPDGTQGMLGVVSRLGRYLVTSLGAAASAHGAAYDLTIDGLPQPWRLSARSQVLEKGYVRDGHEGGYDHFLELDYAPRSVFEIGLVGRSHKLSGAEKQFLLPTLYWQPAPNLTLRARPDFQGDYDYEFWYVYRSTLRMAISVRDRAFANLAFLANQKTQLLAGAERGGGQATLAYLGLQWSGLSRNASTIFGQLSRSQGSWGYRVGGRTAIVPGLMASVDFRDEPSLDERGQRTRSFFAGLNADLALARGRLLPAYSLVSLGMNGSLAGKILLEEAARVKPVSVAGVQIDLDGRPAARTERDGSFFIGNLKDGLYLVELDAEKLPVDLVPATTQLIAEVAAGAVTRVDFKVVREFGIAGRVTDTAGNPITNVELELVNVAGRPVASASTDKFGYYRIDRVRRGSYTLRLFAGQLPALVGSMRERQITVNDDFLFNQDLVVPTILTPNPPR